MSVLRDFPDSISRIRARYSFRRLNHLRRYRCYITNNEIVQMEGEKPEVASKPDEYAWFNGLHPPPSTAENAPKPTWCCRCPLGSYRHHPLGCVVTRPCLLPPNPSINLLLRTKSVPTSYPTDFQDEALLDDEHITRSLGGCILHRCPNEDTANPKKSPTSSMCLMPYTPPWYPIQSIEFPNVVFH